ncbi:hypothetical protein QFC20_007610 [Naganishia adeliensis]|uniref:Uncharacterized protein n=1 Tax=Naganishia adeliensis TaxID=92952 RepID=A0ACC2UXT8_9TREE|nr:hypothetical protein QFC20_007610 [Naganishia adeliensis]
MQGSNDVPFAGSLLRKSSHTTYGRRGRASLAVKEGQGAERRTSPQGKEVETSDLNANTRTDQSTHTQGSELDRNGAVATGVGRKSAPLAADGAATGVKRSGTREVAMVGDLDHTSGSLLTAIVPSPKPNTGSQPSGLPFRRKARMLTRAESFGRTEAQKDQKDMSPGLTASPKDKEVGDMMNDAANLETSFNKPGHDTTPLTPRRALARSTTLATVNVSPSGRSRAPLARTTSMPTSPAKLAIIGQAYSAELERLPSALNLGVPVKRTYGRTRMTESRTDDDQISGQQGEPMETLSRIPQSSIDGEGPSRTSPQMPVLEQRESYADLVKRLEMDEDEDSQDWQESAGSMDYLRNAKSLAELRSRGENRKFMDDLTWLLEGLNDDSLSVRRSSAIDLLNKMSGSGWFEKLRICGQVDDIYSRMTAAREKSTDLGFDLSLLEYLAYVAKAPNALVSILGNHLEEILAFALHVLQSPSIAFEPVANNLKRKKSPALQTLFNLRPLLELTDVNNIPLSASAMAMTVISIATRLCISGHIEPPSIEVQQKMCTVIAEGVHQQLRILPERIEMYETGLDLFSNGTSVDIATLVDAIDVFTAITKAWPVVRAQFESHHCDIATDLANLLLIVQFDPSSLIGLKDDQGKSTDHLDWSQAILHSVAPGSLVLRYLVSSAGRSSAEDSGRTEREQRDATPVISEEGDRDVSLPLGLLFNLMDAAEDGGQALLLETELSLHCTRAKRCVKQCKCPTREPAVRHLCELFNRQQDERNDNPSAAFLAGYLTLLFTKCLTSPTCRKAILAHVTGPNVPSKINTLQDCLQQFAEVYDSVQSRLQQILPTEGDEIGADRENIMPTIRQGLEMLGSIVE